MEVNKLVEHLRFCGDKESICTACDRYDDMGVDGGTVGRRSRPGDRQENIKSSTTGQRKSGGKLA